MAAGTRGAKAMEEQTVQILTALQTQGQQQMEQLTRQFELLAANQQKQHTRATMEMREKLDQLEAVQQDRQHQLERKLAEETSLLTSTQSAMEDKIASLERRLETLREEEAGGATVTLATSAAPARKLREPGSFDGSGSWEAYKTQFQMLAHLNRWSNEEKAVYLSTSLKGPAMAVLNSLSRSNLYDYDALASALEARFGTAHQTELYRTRLKTRIRGREESLPALAEDVENLTRLAYPDATAQPMWDLLAKDRFIDALQEEELRLRLRQARPATLRDALHLALELESCQIASKRRGAPAGSVRGANLDEDDCNSVQKATGESTTLSQILDTLKQLQPDKRPPRGPQRRRRDLSAVECWECHEKGHTRRRCPKLRQPQNTAPRETTDSQSCGAKAG